MVSLDVVLRNRQSRAFFEIRKRLMKFQYAPTERTCSCQKWRFQNIGGTLSLHLLADLGNDKPFLRCFDGHFGHFFIELESLVFGFVAVLTHILRVFDFRTISETTQSVFALWCSSVPVRFVRWSPFYRADRSILSKIAACTRTWFCW